LLGSSNSGIPASSNLLPDAGTPDDALRQAVRC
jgi:hypothetical protein